MPCFRGVILFFNFLKFWPFPEVFKVLRFCLLGSGSSGNAALVYSETTRILIDCGFSFVQINTRLRAVDESVDGLRAVFVTHEHIDHVAGLGVLCRKTGVPAHLTTGTYESLPKTVGVIPRVELFEAGDEIRIGDLEITSYSVSHDAADPVSYIIRNGGAKLGFATDLGHCSHLVRARLAGCHALVLESNYCPEMLRTGGYPPQVQQRIRSRIGHLSNHDMSALLSELLHDSLQTVVLVHISANNNSPDLAHAMATEVVRDRAVELVVAAQDVPTRLFEVLP